MRCPAGWPAKGQVVSEAVAIKNGRAHSELIGRTYREGRIQLRSARTGGGHELTGAVGQSAVGVNMNGHPILA